MRLQLLFSLLFLSFANLSISQQSKNLVGTWYGKIPAYRFKQDGPAQCFSKNKPSNFTRLLIIDSKLNYTYQEFNTLDTTQYRGHVIVINDTLKFDTQQFFLFALNKSQLIYSTFQVENSKDKSSENDSIFQPVEIDAEYSKGKYQFLKQLYSVLVNQKSYSMDSVYLNSYEVIITKEGGLELATVKEISAKQEYLNAIKRGLRKFTSPFIPCKQNGSYVTCRYKFVVTY